MAKTSPSGAEPRTWWRRPALAWLVPLSAATAALVIWIATPSVRQEPAADLRSVADSKVSQEAQTRAPVASPAPTAGNITLRDEGQIAQKKEARIAKPERQDQEKFELHDKVDAVTPRTPAATERMAEEQKLPAKQEALRERAAANEVAAST